MGWLHLWDYGIKDPEVQCITINIYRFHSIHISPQSFLSLFGGLTTLSHLVLTIVLLRKVLIWLDSVGSHFSSNSELLSDPTVDPFACGLFDGLSKSTSNLSTSPGSSGLWWFRFPQTAQKPDKI